MSTGSYKRADIVPVVKSLLKLLAEDAAVALPGGSFRRGKNEVGDVEVILTPKHGQLDSANSLIDATDMLLGGGAITKAVIKQKNGREVTRWGSRYRAVMFGGVKFDLFFADQDNLGYIYWLRTGPDSKADRANTYVMTRLKRKTDPAPFNVKDGYVWSHGQKLHIPDESAWFKLLGLPEIPPHERSVKVYASHFNSTRHKWGFPQEFLVQQQTLFDADAFIDYETGARSSIKHSGVKKAPEVLPDFKWERPFLDNGWVWVYVSYGNWSLLPIDHERVQKQKAYYDQNRGDYKTDLHRLNHYLFCQRRVEEMSRIEQSLSSMIDVLRQVAS